MECAVRYAVRCFIAVSLLASPVLQAQPAPAAIAQEERGNFFGDPFEQATSGIPDCPTPAGPMITRAEMRAQAHGRIERGTSCYQAGRCRLPNSFQYDKEIIPRVKKAILADGRFANTSVWAEGQRRWVWLRGCVSDPAEAKAIEQLVRSMDDVEDVHNELVVVKKASRSAAKTR